MERAGKLFIQFKEFIAAVKSGKRAVMYAPDYVVMSQNAYQDLIGNKPGNKPVPVDIVMEAGKDYYWERRLK